MPNPFPQAKEDAPGVGEVGGPAYSGRLDIRVREATERDAADVIALFRSGYGDGYSYPEFYDDLSVRKMILSDETLMLVAERLDPQRIVGTASVILEIGAFSDLIGEFGRLVVLRDERRRGVGKRLMQARLDRVRDRLHVGIVEARTAHPYSCAIASQHGFAPVGILPNRLIFGGEREHGAVYLRHFGDALALRKNHPHIIPEVYELAALAMGNVGLDLDAIIDEQAESYPHAGDAEIEELEAEGYASLLRIERGRVRNREVFGPLRLHYGRFKLLTTHAHYLIARKSGRVVGAVGFILDRHEKHLRIFELIQLDEAAARQLLAELGNRAVNDWGLATMEIDVAADAPRLQRTLLELEYRPACYLPAHSFHEVERRDVVKMWRLLQPAKVVSSELPEPMAAIAEAVLGGLREQRIRPRVRKALDGLLLFSGLTEEQAGRLAGLIDYARLAEGDCLFERGERGEHMYVVIEGAISIEGEDGAVGTVGQGECAGEVALLTGDSHSATAIAVECGEAGILARARLEGLVRQRPDIGVALYRNLARELGQKLRRADFDRTSRSGGG